MVKRYPYVTFFFIIIIILNLFIDKAIKQEDFNVTVY